MRMKTAALRDLSMAARTCGTRFFVLADAQQVGHYRIWDRWTMRPVSGTAHSTLADAEREARAMNGQAC